MVKADEIRDEGSFLAWLEGRSRDDATRFAQRVAMRVAPLLWAAKAEAKGTFKDGIQGIPLDLAVVRALLASGLPSVFTTPERRELSARAGSLCADISRDLDPLIRSVAFACGEAADAMSGDVHYAAANAADVARETADAASADVADCIWEHLREDARALEEGFDLSSRALWSIPDPLFFRRASKEFRPRWQADPAFAFWLRWWDGVVSGDQVDWALQEKVALIPNEVWEAGPGAVAERIALIEEQMRLLREAERLKAELAAARSEIAALSTRSHNNPPELVEPIAEIERQAGEIAETLEAATQELKSNAPRPAELRRVVGALLAAVRRCLTYFASKGDVALTKAAEEVGSLGAKALIGAGLFAWISQLEAVKTLARALEAFATLLGG